MAYKPPENHPFRVFTRLMVKEAGRRKARGRKWMKEWGKEYRKRKKKKSRR